MSKIQRLFLTLGRKTVNINYISKLAVRIEQILRQEAIPLDRCFYDLKPKGKGKHVVILEDRKLFVRHLAIAECEADSQADRNYGLLSCALQACGMKVSPRFWMTGLGPKHPAKIKELPELKKEVSKRVKWLRARYNLQ